MDCILIFLRLVAITNILYFNSEFILANIVLVRSSVNVDSRVFFVISHWLGRLGNHSLR